MSKARKFLILIIVILLFALLSLIVYNVVIFPTMNGALQNNGKKEHDNIITFEDSQYKYLNFCQENVQCPMGTMEYQFISASSSYPKLVSVVDKINSKVSKSYEISSTSSGNVAECAAFPNTFIHSIANISSVSVYEDNQIVNISYINTEQNLCSGVSTSSSFDTYFYDIQKDEFFNQDKFMKRYGVTEDEVLASINSNLNELNSATGTSYSYDENNKYQLFINYDGQIRVYYKVVGDNMSFNTFINKRVN